MEFKLESIGVIHSPFKKLDNMPVQPRGGKNIIAEIEIKEKYQIGLKDLDSFSHIYLIYIFHKMKFEKLEVIPFNDRTNQIRGVFATRTPVHPNGLGLSIVKLLKVEKNILTIQGVDILDETPIIDIKPYIENFDKIDEPTKSGWMLSTEKEVALKKSDNRFI